METAVTDTVGDEAAARSGGPRPSSVPRYRRIGGGRVVGLDAGLRIERGDDRSGGGGGLSVTPGGRRPMRYMAGRSLGEAKRRLVGRKLLQTEGTGPDEDFIAVTGYKDRKALEAKRHSETDLWIGHQFAGTEKKTQGTGDDDDGSGNSEEEKGNNEGEGSDSGDSGDESGYGEEASVKSLQKRIAQLDAEVRATPDSVDTWLDLIDAQADLVAAQHDQDRKGPARSSVAQAQRDVQLAVVERSLNAHPTNKTSIKIKLKRLDIVSQDHRWQPKDIDDEWHNILQSAEDKTQANEEMAEAHTHLQALFDLWSKYLDWRQSGDLNDFTVSKMEELLQFALQRFRVVYFKTLSMQEGAPIRDAVEFNMIQLIKRSVLLLREAGLIERAHGLLQALCQLSFKRPKLYNRIDDADSFERALDSLGDFWDLELPRMGEEGGANSWASFVAGPSEALKIEEAARNGTTRDQDVGQMPAGLNDSDPIVRWISLEYARAKLRKGRPAKVTRDEPDWTVGESEIDPFAFVLFDDLKPYMVPLVSKSARVLLLDTFLGYLGFPALLSSEIDDDDQSHLVDPLASRNKFWPACLDAKQNDIAPRTWEVIGGEIMARENQSGLARPFEMPIRSTCHNNIDVLFSRSSSDAAEAKWFSTTSQYSSIERRKNDGGCLETAKLLLEHAQGGEENSEVCLASMALAASTSGVKAATKMAKKLLAVHRDDVDLWCAYAQMQRSRGDIDLARTVYKSVLQQSSQTASLAVVWASWSEMELIDASSVQSCLDVTCLAAKASLGPATNLEHTSAAGPAEKLRARRFFSSLSDSETSTSSSVYGILCAALFAYSGQPREEALSAVVKVIKESPHAKDERLALFLAKVAWYHVHQQVSRAPASYRPAEIRAILQEAVEQHGENTSLWSLFGAFEMRSKIEGVFRTALERATQSSTTTVRLWLLRIYFELHMNAWHCNEGTVRLLFERTTEQHPSSVVVWRLYLDFEVRILARIVESIGAAKSAIKTARTRAMQVLYRALAKCPFSRALYLAAFRAPLRGAMSDAELRTLARLMEERHVRCYSSLDRFLDAAPASKPISSSSSSPSSSMSAATSTSEFEEDQVQ